MDTTAKVRKEKKLGKPDFIKTKIICVANIAIKEMDTQQGMGERDF